MIDDPENGLITRSNNNPLQQMTSQVILVAAISAVFSFGIYTYRADIFSGSNGSSGQSASKIISNADFTNIIIIEDAGIRADIPLKWTKPDSSSHTKLISDENFSAYSVSDEQYMIAYYYKPGEAGRSAEQLLEFNKVRNFSNAEIASRDSGVNASGNDYVEVSYDDIVEGLAIIYRDRYTTFDDGGILHTQSWSLKSKHDDNKPIVDKILDSISAQRTI